MTLPSRGLGRWLTLRGVTERVTGAAISYLTSWGRHLGVVGAAILDRKSWGPPSWCRGAAILDLTSWRHWPYSGAYTTTKKREKSTLSASFYVIFSWPFWYADRKSCSIFGQNFQPDFLLCFSVIRWNFGIFLVLFNGGVLLLVEWTWTDPVY